MKWTLPKLRREAWKRLAKVKAITLTELKDCSARADWEEDDKTIAISIDNHTVDIRKAVAHELVESIMQEEVRKIASYDLYELWMEAIEKKFFEKMSKKDLKKWRKAIDKKINKRKL